MERSAKNANKAKAEEKKFAKTIDDALGRLQADPEARMELSKLKRAGFQERRIAELMLLYCGGDPKDAEAGRQQVESYANQLQDCGEKLKSVATSLEDAEKVLVRFGRDFDGDDLPKKMRDFADVLLWEAKNQKNGLRRMRLGSTDEAGREAVLAYLVYFLAGKGKPSARVYETIAKMAIAVARKRVNVISMSDKLRKITERFLNIAANPGALVESARAEFDEQQIKSSRSTTQT